jgi:haloalkane dehalogenase
MIDSSLVHRTPDDRFSGLPDYPFAPHYCQVTDAQCGALRMHYIDEGPRDAPVVLMLHGEPTWSYLYRKMIGPVASAGYRVIAPDHIGFGRSDKPKQRSVYSYQGYVDWLCQFIAALNLQRITLVCQDWGGPIGLRVLSEMPHRFNAVLATNTLLPNCEVPPRGVADWPGKQIADWIDTCRNARDLPISEIVAGTCVQRPSADVLRAYDAPFPDASYKTAALQITCLIPIDSSMAGIEENRRAWNTLEKFTPPFLTAFSDNDPSTKAWEAIFRQRVPGAELQPHCEIKNAGHFVQEEKGEELAAVLIDFQRQIYGDSR